MQKCWQMQGVDAVFFDSTNGSVTWKESYEALMKTWDQAQKDGVNVPKIAFMLPFGPAPNSLVSLRQLYRDVYKPNLYKNLWFIWKGKPCIMGYPDNLTNSTEDKEIAEFFTFRPGQPDYVNGPKRNDQWGWLENYPQHGYVKGENGKPNARYWVLKLLKIFKTQSGTSNVVAQGFITNDGKKLLLINKGDEGVQLDLPAESKGAWIRFVDITTGDNPPSKEQISGNTIKLNPFSVAVIRFKD